MKCPACQREMIHDDDQCVWRCFEIDGNSEIGICDEDVAAFKGHKIDENVHNSIRGSIRTHSPLAPIHRVEFDPLKTVLATLENISDSHIKAILQPIYEYLYKRGCRIN